MYYNFKNCKVLLNNNPICANSVDISLPANIEPSFLAEQFVFDSYTASNSIIGTLRLNYYLTGVDFLKNYTTSDGNITGSIGGLTFNSGYLKTYSFNSSPNSPAVIGAEIIFVDVLTGSFTPTYETVAPGQILNFGSVAINGTTFGDLTNVLEYSFAYSADIQPNFIMNDTDGQNNISCYDVLITQKQKVASVKFDNLNQELPITGKKGDITINFNNSGGATQESYAIAGNIFEKNTEVSVNGLLSTVATIKQDSALPEPTITGFWPPSIVPGQQFFVSGTNFGFDESQLISVYVNGDPATINLGYLSSIRIKCLAPDFAKTGPITVITIGGLAQSSSSLVIEDPGIYGF